MQPVYGFGRDAHRGIKPERDIGLGNIVVNRFWQGNDMQPGFFKPQRVFSVCLPRPDRLAHPDDAAGRYQ